MVVMNSIIQKSTFIFYASNSTYLKYQYTYLSALCLLKKIKHVTSNSHIHQHENSSTITVAYRWRKEHVESNYWTQLICGHRRLSLVNYMIMHKNDLLVTLLWNNDDPKVKLRTYCIVRRIETQKNSPLEHSHKANDSNEIEFQLVPLLPRTTVTWPSKSLVTARYFFGSPVSPVSTGKVYGCFEKRNFGPDKASR